MWCSVKKFIKKIFGYSDKDRYFEKQVIISGGNGCENKEIKLEFPALALGLSPKSLEYYTLEDAVNAFHNGYICVCNDGHLKYISEEEHLTRIKDIPYNEIRS